MIVDMYRKFRKRGKNLDILLGRIGQYIDIISIIFSSDVFRNGFWSCSINKIEYYDLETKKMMGFTQRNNF